ncbi:MAG: tRNA uridine-5-carboxymethylaminomethyl(34) synthesis GTPase MnmE [Acidobacteria bacterium]|nr:tRNA uridine-5-carboxymethylaminomethyl(34) synthesis GTPase MnmE [Acidobacteriota bacterium]MBP7474028.1 tRNA uridine-5-carboxymethylaminomethyl(34) synthesis GTPase MnmE [Pyrinomonadaceae bacterium]MBP9109933.1 tRNA uridine-5-carboxymethylaminomethyl(34) synthesis GTPase MnmE [Pyrinomonadaceae bacterium]
MPDTIVALATPTGRSGIGVIRLSGDNALGICRNLVSDQEFSPEPRKAHLRQLHDLTSGETIDESLITYFRAPHSFTGEDVVEMSCHGSPVLLRQVIDICLKLDARMAEAGEFSLRALANGRIDLAEAEAIRDLIDSQSAASARQAVRQMRGEMSQSLQPLKDDLLNIIVVLESALEFVEDDLPPSQLDSVTSRLVEIASEAKRLAETYDAGHLIREGLRVALVGRPNVGKSSLFNALLGSDRAIVADIAGTTRDQIHERFIINDIPISLIDTAGLRDTTDTVESIGVERSRATIADADMVIVMLDASEQTSDEDREILESVKDLSYLVALNKIDKLPSTDIDKIVASEHSSLSYLREKIVPLSAKTGEGLDDLRQAIIRPFGIQDVSTLGFLVTDARHHDLLIRTKTEIEQSIQQLNDKMSEEIVLIGLHNALRYLGEITGETTTEDMLSRIFSTFCIGK